MARDLRTYQGRRTFDGLIEQWKRKHGNRAVPSLLILAGRTDLEETERYMALLAAARLGGARVAQDAVPFLKNPSWMLRSGALRILSTYRITQRPGLLYERLKDPALVIRSQAAQAVGELKPAGWQSALSGAILDPTNYAGGKAQIVPQKALEALIKSGDPSSRTRIKASATKIPDPAIRARVQAWN